MASVSSLDKDLRNSRLGRYTPQAANEVRAWVEEVLGERLAAGDILEALKDGTALCKLANLATGSPGVRYKESSMPFVQMENISHFLRACQNPPLNLPPHDVFLTVDLYEAKDPAQVLQCIGAFSRSAHTIHPNRFPTAIGSKSKNGTLSPQGTGGYLAGSGTFARSRGASNASDTSSVAPNAARYGAGGRTSPTKSYPKDSSSTGNSISSPGGVSSWSRKTDEGATTPAWNIHQYGYMGGASQGNQGISFGGRRQITTPGPNVPSLAEKERRRRQEESEAERLRIQAEETEYKRRIEREAEEEREKLAEQRRWEEETKRQREREKREVEEEKRRWEAEEKRWKEEEEMRVREEREIEAKIEKERQRKRANSDARLKGQFLSQYQAEQRQLPIRAADEDNQRSAERDRVKELERQLAEAKEREQAYDRERQERLNQDRRTLANGSPPAQRQSYSTDISIAESRDRKDSWQGDEREYLRNEWTKHRTETPPPAHPPAPPSQSSRPLPIPSSNTNTAQSSRPLPTPAFDSRPPQPPRPLPTPNNPESPPLPLPSRPLPNPATYTSPPPRLASINPIPPSPITPPFPSVQSNTLPIAPPKHHTHAKTPSLLEREMERERQRQQEWEEAQRATKSAAEKGVREGGSGPGESWDVNQYGYLGGDSQNRGGVGLGGRRQIGGPRGMR